MQRTVNIDITDVLSLTYTSGIQRVVREVATRLSRSEELPTRLLRFDAERHGYDVIDQADFLGFVLDHNHQPVVVDELAIEDLGEHDVFLDIDSSWNSPLKRPHLYDILKSNGVFIANVVYDMVPVLLPQLAHENTVRNWATYIAAVYTYSDLVFAISRATERDFLELKNDFGVERHIPTVVTRLAGDMMVTEPPREDEYALFDEFIDERFFLFVGTLEPRKQQHLALRAWERLRASHPDVHFVFVGREGWHSAAMAQQITSHPEFGRRLHWLQRAGDRVLAHLYERSFACVYLSSYEGYGLPVAEALARGKLIITSRNSSMYEVGGEAADYTFFDTSREVAATMASYLDTTELVEARTEMIRSTFEPATWDSVSETIGRALARLDASLAPVFAEDSLQFVYISNDADRVVRSMRAYAADAPVKDFLVIAPEAVARDVAAHDVGAPLRVITDEELLGERRDEFHASDHVGRNWMLRSSLPSTDAVDPVFVMLDDDSLPLGPIGLEEFVNDDGTFNAFYYGDLVRWPRGFNSYDDGQFRTRSALQAAGLELLSYSSHQPQVIDKTLFGDAVEFFEAQGETALDEWSAYFNYAASLYPTRFRKEVYRTLNWPMSPTDWEPIDHPLRYRFENVYDVAYESGVFAGLEMDSDPSLKLERKQREVAPYERARSLAAQARPTVTEVELTPGIFVVASGDLIIAVSGLPSLITLSPDAMIRLEASLQIRQATPRPLDIEIVLAVPGQYEHPAAVRTAAQGVFTYDAALISLPVFGHATGHHAAEFVVKINGTPLPGPYNRFATTIVVVPEESTIEESFRSLPESGPLGEVAARLAPPPAPSRGPRMGVARRMAKWAVKRALPSLPDERRRVRAFEGTLSALEARIEGLAVESRATTDRLRGIAALNRQLTAARVSIAELTARAEEQAAEQAAALERLVDATARRDSRLDELSRLLTRVDQDQPLFGLAGVGAVPVGPSADRARMIERIVGPLVGVSVLDVGSSLGYMTFSFAERGAVTAGWERDPDRVAIAKQVASINGVGSQFVLREFGLDSVRTIQSGEFDVALVLDVLHHVVSDQGLETAREVVRELVERIPVIVFELARPDEHVDAEPAASQPADPLDLFATVRDLADVEIVGHVPSGVAGDARPLVKVARRQIVEVNGKPYPYSTVSAVAYEGSPMAGTGARRRYYFGDGIVIKEYEFASVSEQNLRQTLRELNIYSNTLVDAEVWHGPRMLDFELTRERSKIVLAKVDGMLLSDVPRGFAPEVAEIARDVLRTLGDLAAAGVFHNDVRSWNIIVGADGASLIDYGLSGPNESDGDVISLLWALHTALTGIREGYEVGKSHLPPRSAFSEAHLVAFYDAVANGERDPETLLALLHVYAATT